MRPVFPPHPRRHMGWPSVPSRTHSQRRERLRHRKALCGFVARSAGIATTTFVVPPGESSKSLEKASEIYDRLIDCRANRHFAIIAIGGGVIGDLAGFVAATFARGVPLLMIPTTLLAQVDSSVGGKVGVNHPRQRTSSAHFISRPAFGSTCGLLNLCPIASGAADSRRL